MENKSNKDGEDKPKNFHPKVLLIWLAILAAVIGLAMAQSPGVTPSHSNITSINDLMLEARDGNIDKAVIESDPKGGEEWYAIQGNFKNPAYLATSNEDEYQLLPFYVKGRVTESEYKELRNLLGGKLRENPSTTIWTDLLFSLLPFLLIIGLLYFLFVRQLRMAGKGALNFGKSKAKLLTKENEKIVFDNVAGCDEAKEEVSEIVDFLKDPKRFRKIGGKIPKGVLMVGPPGTGKTLLAKAVAGEADVPFFSISGSDFVEMFVGVGAARVRDMFEQGRKSAPCLIFIDEIDAVGRQRGAGLGGGNDEREQTLNSLLVEMDGFDGHEGVIIIAATNRPDVLDNALLRPGRFDRQVVIDLPDLEGREAILKVHAKKIKLSDDVDLNSLARATASFSGADLANLLNEGALIAARRRKKMVERIDLDDAREKISFGTERRRAMDDEDRKIIAYHEAGHAIMGALEPNYDTVRKVSIIPRGEAGGVTFFQPDEDNADSAMYSKEYLLSKIRVALGGRAAEELIYGKGGVTTGASSDYAMVYQIAREMVTTYGFGKRFYDYRNMSEDASAFIDEEIDLLVGDCYDETLAILRSKMTQLEQLKGKLIEEEIVDGQWVYELMFRL